MTIEKIQKLGKDMVDIIMMIPMVATLSTLGTHIIPHVYVESSSGESYIFPSREMWNVSSLKEKVEMTALYTGGLAGLLAEVGLYYNYSKEINPFILSIPVITNGISVIYELYNSKRK